MKLFYFANIVSFSLKTKTAGPGQLVTYLVDSVKFVPQHGDI